MIAIDRHKNNLKNSGKSFLKDAQAIAPIHQPMLSKYGTAHMGDNLMYWSKINSVEIPPLTF